MQLQSKKFQKNIYFDVLYQEKINKKLFKASYNTNYKSNNNLDEETI